MKILYFSTVNWNWIKQRPHFEAYYMSENNITIEYFSITPLFKQKISSLNHANNHLKIRDQYVLPLAARLNFIKKLNSAYVRQLLKKDYDYMILTHPDQYQYLSKSQVAGSKVIYECMDNMPFFCRGERQKQVFEEEKKLCSACHRIITSSSYLKDRILSEYGINNNKIKVIKNAVDTSFIENDVIPAKLKHPNLMYIGTISEWIDIEGIDRFAKENPEYTIYLIGPASSGIKRTLKSMDSNISLLGTITHEAVKSYIQAGDIMLIPFKVNELIKGVDPVKMYEYLALNKPVVTTYWEELSQYTSNELVSFYSDYNEFRDCIYRIRKQNNIKMPSINIDFINQNSWRARVKEYIEFL